MMSTASRRTATAALLAAALAPGLAAEEFFEAEYRALTLFTSNDLASTPLNPANNLRIPDRRYQLHLRPDFFYRHDKLDISAKPRLIVDRRRIENGVRVVDEGTVSDAFLNEYWVRYRFDDRVYGSFGRENLQWGPSYLLSPSNPFLNQNGRQLPQFEVPGLDYARLVWIPSSHFTVSLISNFDEGRLQTAGRYQDIHALKMDWTWDRSQASIIASHREGGQDALGYFALRHFNDAQLGYLEGSTARGRTSMLVGTAYTFKGGESAALEYFYDGRGLLLQGEGVPTTASSVNALGGAFLNPLGINLQTLGRDEEYLLFQFNDFVPAAQFSWTLRIQQSLSGGGARLIGIGTWMLSDNLEVFVNGARNAGGDRFGFGAFLDEQVLVGAKYTF